MSMATPFPEPASRELERFALYGRQEILGLLGDLRERQVLVTLYYDQSAGFTVSNVLDVNDALDEVIFDCAADRSAQQALCEAREVVLVGFIDNAKIQFSVGRGDAVSRGGRPAFRVALPRYVLRMQRRSAARHRPLLDRPATCLVPVAAEPGRFEAVPVLDISVGGVAIAAHPNQFDMPNQFLTPCYLDLPEVGQVNVSLKVRYLEPIKGSGNGRRCGCEFVDLGGVALRSVQRYVNRLEAETAGRQRAA
ncbi:MAG: flagellar brake protein [Burkholderiaceae bacterium]